MLITTDEAQKIAECFNEDRKTAERYLLHFKEIEADYEEQKEAYVNYKENDDNVGGGRSGVGNPTEQKALKNIEYDNLSQSARWLKAVTICRAGLGERKNIFITCRIEAETRAFRNGDRGRKAWIIYTQQRYNQEIEKRFLSNESIAEITVRRWWQSIIDRVVYIANKIYK
ncbi:hypothetical protein [Pectinatus frisingensis]|uniref:hypothetical protein n=1 Tax=Pectinatus frisingensis TaxID=865 RepID=UPI0018C78C29|nr:hypothetical protein [Pectinatus frisingensis]